MKSYTTLEQSKQLAKILPLDSADMYYAYDIIYAIPYKNGIGTEKPCWSLAALLDILNKTAYSIDEDASVNLSSYKAIEWNLGIDNSDLELIIEADPIDACVQMILKLNELKLL